MNFLAVASELPQTTYYRETLRPWPNLLFIAPLLLVYEIGMTWLQLPGIRNGADAWMRTMILSWGAPGGWLLPAAVVLSLLTWHVSTQQTWRVQAETLLGMASESLLYACGLILVGQFVEAVTRLNSLPSLSLEALWQAGMVTEPGMTTRLLNFLGAGIYEEFLFRLCLLPAAYVLFSSLLLPRRGAFAAAVLSTSLVFALAHYAVPASDVTALSVLSDAVAQMQSRQELWFGFGFRVLAGVVFALLFCFRGFGIAVGAHALYDIVVGCILTSEL